MDFYGITKITFPLIITPLQVPNFLLSKNWSLTTTLRFLVAFLFFLAFVITAVMLDRKGALTVVSWYLGTREVFGENGAMVVIFEQKEHQELRNKENETRNT